MIRALLFALATILAQPVAAQPALPVPAPDLASFGGARLFSPDGRLHRVVVLFSSNTGWSAREDAAAGSLRKNGATVVGVDLPAYVARLNAVDGPCVFPLGDIEGISRQLQRAANIETYIAPAIAGFDAGGGLVLSIAQQTPAVTIDLALSVDTEPASDLAKPLCKADPAAPVSGINTILAAHTPRARGAGDAIAAKLSAAGLGIQQMNVADDAAAFAPLIEMLNTPPRKDPLAAIPLVELPTANRSDTLAVVYSGDGGWRDLDKTIAEYLQAQGVPVIGVDSLRYFWSEKLPPEIARDLDLIAATYGPRWGTSKLLLIGYSFGAGILPETFNVLPSERQKEVRQISLLGLETEGTFEISIAGWLGAEPANVRPVLPQLARIDPKLIQCFYGKDEEDSACLKLDPSRVEVIGTEGGHHFDGDYDALARRILDGLKRR
jgi:type IV secretory pathway VirJ component